jgi:hypothetical protein
MNENPVVQIAVLGMLAVVVAFLLMTRVMKGEDSATPASTDVSAASSAASATGATTETGTTPSTPQSSDGAAAPSAASMPAPEVGDFVAGPGLPGAMVKAYEDDQTVVLLVVRHNGIDDAVLRRSVERLRSRSGVALFVTRAKHIARYARITEGVSVERVPALVVLRPRRLSDSAPSASVSYGFRGPDSVDQAIRDALYDGPKNLPAYPK